MNLVCVVASQVIRVDVRDPKHKRVFTEDGNEYEFDHLVSTMPLDLLICSIDGLPGFSKQDLKEMAEQFRCVFLCSVAGARSRLRGLMKPSFADHARMCVLFTVSTLNV